MSARSALLEMDLMRTTSALEGAKSAMMMAMM
jgi:hypothetical protein